MSDKLTDETRETGDVLLPKFGADGLITGVVQDVRTLEILMVAFLDAEALTATQETGFAHFHSRSRSKLWKKGETSGNTLKVIEMRIDCDQDALVILAEPAGPACHTGARTCFYRKVEGASLAPVRT
ncbi:phosphoribosyl-AMP cyclohydrolase [Qipengyuania atrilutea]|uniref:Phosphoribosyl-AMP cyclohydrolase n=1 Tax=Qipengyuania atrilutea TaxID=2744473 RepID=A0A850GW64_9SPHN|nr:phosphoribosyl-AMP cyclohydrolase [Actirhodobacter atriluteus]NVD43771.1 phosphoribosyl-AMP cyclohydrolase [Actirhodobacter atriluteus]